MDPYNRNLLKIMCICSLTLSKFNQTLPQETLSQFQFNGSVEQRCRLVVPVDRGQRQANHRILVSFFPCIKNWGDQFKAISTQGCMLCIWDQTINKLFSLKEQREECKLYISPFSHLLRYHLPWNMNTKALANEQCQPRVWYFAIFFAVVFGNLYCYPRLWFKYINESHLGFKNEYFYKFHLGSRNKYVYFYKSRLGL